MDKTRTSMARIFGAETRGWIRTIDALVVLLVPVAIAGALFYYSVKIEITLLRTAFYIALVCVPLMAYLLYRESDLGRLERIAILGLVLSLGLALMIAAMEAARPA